MDSNGLSFFHAVVWDKTARGPGLGWRYRRDHEFIMLAHVTGGRLAWVEGSAASSNIVRVAPVRERLHPNEKPVVLVEHFLRLHTQPGDLVLDPFAGSGTVGVACAQMGREFLGFEIDPHWCEVAKARIKSALRGVRVEELLTGQTTFGF